MSRRARFSLSTPPFTRTLVCALGLAVVPACGADDADAGAGTQDAGAGGQLTGGQLTGGENAGGQLTGGQLTGGQVMGGQNAGGENAGGTPVPTPDAGPAPELDVGPAPVVDAGPAPELDAGPAPELDAGPVPELDAGPGPAVGACVNAADQETLAASVETLESAVGTCAFQCIADPAPGTCAGACVSMATGLSEGCAACFGGAVACTIANCIGQCLDAASQACADCRATNCNDDFSACAGIDPQ